MVLPLPAFKTAGTAGTFGTSFNPMAYSTANGLKIYYEVSGEGFPFVMVHANPFDHNLWMYQIAHFSTYFKVIAIDIRGYGR